ncbi:unnamed protein product [Peronospora belbahrii]|uniref:C2 domain-containing protein n=1 Tax=Peronospora belbahrii TaxID=622444 RepID=A0AAU9LAW3_9STRA|nr:unnamed protein product [Peronospora belbahrii]CAH0522748.1 unnamed protein product [Peronospora belbahrii]
MYAVHVTLVKAVDLPSADLNGKSDPYVIFKVATVTRQSSIIPATLNPEWKPEETFYFIANDLNTDVLDVQVFDHDRFSKDDKIGFCTVPLSKFSDQIESEVLMFKLEIPIEFAKQNRKSAIMLEVRVEKED